MSYLSRRHPFDLAKSWYSKQRHCGVN